MLVILKDMLNQSMIFYTNKLVEFPGDMRVLNLLKIESNNKTKGDLLEHFIARQLFRPNWPLQLHKILW